MLLLQCVKAFFLKISGFLVRLFECFNHPICDLIIYGNPPHRFFKHLGQVLLTETQSLDEVLLIPDEEVGKMPVREKLKTEAIKQKTRFKTGWLVWSEVNV